MKTKKRRSLNSRRAGFAVVYVALVFTTLLGVAALVVDIGYIYARRAEAQKAADSAALAGAAELAFGTGPADVQARDYATFYGYTDGENNAEVTTSRPTGATFRVSLNRLEPIFFARVLGFAESRVGASAIATYASPTNLPFKNNGNLASITSAFESVGPYGWGPKPPAPGVDAGISRGDRYSVEYCNDGITPNSAYDPKGYEFQFSVPNNYNQQLAVEIFDPDSAGAYDEVQIGPSMFRSPSGNPVNKTDYSVIYTDPITKQESVVTNVVYDPADPNYGRNDGKWAQDLLVDIASNPQYKAPGALKLRVKSLDGSSENGFYIRTGPPHDPAMTDDAWEAKYGPASNDNGTGFAADGRVSMNFFKTGTARIDLGFVPAGAAGADITITRYDLEPGGKTIVYKTDAVSSGIPANGQTTTPTGDGVELSDKITLPADYAGGNWWVEYSAGIYDSSSWDISYPGTTAGTIRLIQ